MASKTWFTSIALMLVLCMPNALAAAAAAAGVICESLDVTECAFAVSSSGLRCVLEKSYVRRRGLLQEEVYTCSTSEIGAEEFNDWVETADCVAACGLDRNTVGISSDSLVESDFQQKLCSAGCYHGCPNVVDLYFNLAAGEGVFLPSLCEAQRRDGRRAMAEIRSSGVALMAEGPAHASTGKLLAFAPSTMQFSEMLYNTAPTQAPM